MKDLAAILKKEVRGEILTDVVSCGIYATDASNYEIFPRAVAIPASAADVLRILAIAREENVPIIPRGGGTSLAGQTTGDGIVVDFSKHLNRILKIDPERRTARVQPGIVRDELNLALHPYGLHFAPDPATANRANIGGMIGNNSAGTRSIVFGKTVDHVLGTKIALADGAVLDLARLSRAEYEGLDTNGPSTKRTGRHTEILSALKRMVERDRDEIVARFPKVMRRVQGYNLDELLDPDDWNPAKLFVGSEGTLGMLLEAELNLEPVPRYPSMCIPQFRSLMDAIRAVEGILRHGPSCVEILDDVVIRLAHENLTTAPLVDFLDGSPPAALIVEFFGQSSEHAEELARGLAKELITQGIATSCPIRLDADGMSRVWEVRKHGLGLMLGIKGDKKPIPFIEDAAVPVAVLPEYIEQVLAVCEANDTKVALYAHASVGLLHVRPILDLKQQQDIDRMKRIADETFALVRKYGGSWSGEHGDGLVRSPWLREYFGDRIYETLREVKTLFDPAAIMNPGKIVDAGPVDDHLRFGTAYKSIPLTEAFDYHEDRTFLGAIEMCTGVGACRKTIGGTMCPSYRATRDEEHSTRGRANALRLALTGRIPGGLANPDLQDALDLCLSCKACKSECPSNVDLAKLKAEYLHQLDLAGALGWRKKMLAEASIRNRSIAGHWSRPLLMNPLTESIAKRLLGLHAGRRLPRTASRSFAQWFDSRAQGARAGTRTGAAGAKPHERVVLFDDCFLHGYEPEIGVQVTESLEAMGYAVERADAGCCQRPRISGGLLGAAKRDGRKTAQALLPIVTAGIPVVVCEPSCASALRDDLPDLIEDDIPLDWFRQILPLEEFLAAREELVRERLEGPRDTNSVRIHGHCHQKALWSGKAIEATVRALGIEDVATFDTGCCGMAGSFGYEAKHYAVSQAIGEDRLYPAVRAMSEDAHVLANGFSCRHQIVDGTGTHARHLASFLFPKVGTANR